MDNSEIKKAGLKITAPRTRVLKILETARNRHLSAEDIYKELLDSGEDIGLATVYRVLTQFETAGLVVKQRFEGEHFVYELDQGEHHDHLVCVQCGHVEEFVDEVIERRQQEIAQSKGFEITDHSLYLYGLCPSCQAIKK